jgi:enamine deaminase RidA (YjgF/YER057c/UK114 family)
MKRSIKTYESDAVQVQLASFRGKGGVTEYHALLSLADPLLPFGRQLENLCEAYTRLTEELPAGTAAVFRRYFLSDAANQADEVMGRERNNPFCALSLVQQAPANGTKAALWVYLLSGGVTTRTHTSSLFEAGHNGYRHFWSGGLSNKAANSEYQTRILLNDYIMQLSERQCTLAANCIRTWLFVRDVDINYAGVVKARREVFLTQNLTDKTHYIASTGIEGRHADPAVHVLMDAYSVDGLSAGQIQFLYARTHLNPTYEYGVTFERGVAVTYGDRRQIYISGTASINNCGEIVHPGDVLLQAERMLENISVLLREAGASADDIMQAIVYLRDPADYAAVNQYLEANVPQLPRLIVLAPVCRPGWLIEMECIAVVEAETDFAPL